MGEGFRQFCLSNLPLMLDCPHMDYDESCQNQVEEYRVSLEQLSVTLSTSDGTHPMAKPTFQNNDFEERFRLMKQGRLNKFPQALGTVSKIFC